MARVRRITGLALVLASVAPGQSLARETEPSAPTPQASVLQTLIVGVPDRQRSTSPLRITVASTTSATVSLSAKVEAGGRTLVYSRELRLVANVTRTPTVRFPRRRLAAMLRHRRTVTTVVNVQGDRTTTIDQVTLFR